MIIDIEEINDKFYKIVNSKEWKELQIKFNHCNEIYVIGHGGNLAIADHTAVDITRLSNGQKSAVCPSSSVLATSLINDSDFDQWIVNWLSYRTGVRNKSQMSKSLVYGISSSGKSRDVLKALQWASDHGMKTCLITGQPVLEKIEGMTTIVLGTKYYHTSEVLTLLLQYQLTEGSGKVCPPIGKNSHKELEKLNWKGKEIREHSFPDEASNLGIDFDGVIHRASKGFYDGTIYDQPVEGAKEALEMLSKNYNLIVYTCKSKPDRGLINGKTGTELIWEWLDKNELSQYITKVTSEKPRAVAYIDDKAILFKNWESALNSLENFLEKK